MYSDFAQILAAASKKPAKVIVPCANNPEALEAVGQAITAHILSGGILIGDPDAIVEVADDVHLDRGAFEIIPTEDDPSAAATVAAELVRDGYGDILLKGKLMTSEYLKPILKPEMGLIPEGNLLSHVSLMQIPKYHKLLMLTDAAVNINPTVTEKKQMVMNAVRVMQSLGLRKPKVAMTAAIEKVNPKIQSTVDAAHVRDELRDEYPDELYIDGPYDILIAVSKSAAEGKGITGDVSGDADILLFHEINGANAAYKLLTAFLPDYLNASIVTGAKIPLVLPSRADPVSTKLLSIALAAVLMCNQGSEDEDSDISM